MHDLEMFALEWERVWEAAGLLVLLSFFVERLVAIVVETRTFVLRTAMPKLDSVESKREYTDTKIAHRIKGSQTPDDVNLVLADITPDSRLWSAKLEPEKAKHKAETYLNWIQRIHTTRVRLSQFPIKEFIAVGTAIAVCFIWNIDIFNFALRADETKFWGKILSAIMVAGGSKASIRLFHDLLGIKSHAVQEMSQPKSVSENESPVKV